MKLKEFAGDELALEYPEGMYPMPRIYVDDYGSAVVEWVESLRFHVEHGGDLMRALGLDDGLPQQAFKTQNAISDVFADAGVPGVMVDDGSHELGDDSDHGALLLYIDLPESALDLDIESGELFDLAWDFLATCANLTDPGTFGSPYLFSEVARKLDIDPNDLAA